MRSPFLDTFFSGPSPDMESRVRKGRAPRDAEDLPRHLGMGDVRRRGWDRKQHNVSYAFIRRWLRSRVGRRWDDVWSELCSFADSRSFAGETLRTAVRFEVDMPTRRDEDGRLVVSSPYYGLSPASGLAVDPEGFLRFVTDRSRPRVEPPVERVVRGPMRELLLIEGRWYDVRFEPLPPITTSRVELPDGGFRVVVDDPGGWDLLDRAHVRRKDSWRARDRHAVAKRALSRDELRRNGMVNDPDAEPAHNRRGQRR